MMKFGNRLTIICGAVIIIIGLSCNTQNPVTKSVLNDTGFIKKDTPKQPLRDSLPRPTGLVNDYEKILTQTEIDSLETIIGLFEKETTVQIAIITMDSTMTTAMMFDETILQIANAWGVGKKNKNNGVVIGVSKQFRKMRIQVGLGVEDILTDAAAKRIIDEDFIPFFKQGNYYEGVKKGLLSLMKKLREKYTA